MATMFSAALVLSSGRWRSSAYFRCADGSALLRPRHDGLTSVNGTNARSSPYVAGKGAPMIKTILVPATGDDRDAAVFAAALAVARAFAAHLDFLHVRVDAVAL